MFSRVTTRAILHSNKNHAFIGFAPSKFRTIFSGTPNQQNHESKPIVCPTIPPAFQSDNASEAIKIAVEQKLHEEEIAGQIRKVFVQFPRLIFEEIEGGTQTETCMTKCSFGSFNVWESCKKWSINSSKGVNHLKAEELFEQQAKKESSYQVPKYLLQDSEYSICSLNDLVCSEFFRSLYDHDNFMDANCCLSPIILQLLRDVVSQLVVLHSWGIVHGDIQPNNISILKGQRLSAKLVNVDCKALEWPHHGSKTPTADLFDLGRLIGFCISEGSYPFGDILAQPHKDLLEKIYKLKRGKYLPEAFHLIYNLLMTPRNPRIEAIDILDHPLFWSPRKRVSFLNNIYGRLRYLPEPDPHSIFRNCIISSHIKDEAWAEDIGSVRLSLTSYEGLLRSLQFVKEMNAYYTADHEPFPPSQPQAEFEPLKDIEAPVYRIVDDYYSRHYPWLLIYLYAFADHSWGRRRGDV